MALEGAHWWVYLWDTNWPPWIQGDNYQYVIRGDSVLSDFAYKKVYYRNMTDQGEPLIENEMLAGLLRDDTLNRKVYAINFNFSYLFNICPQSEEFLLYDFGVSIGDTLSWCLFIDYWGPIIVNSIEYEFVYGTERKVINDVYSGIEGIGTNYGPFEFGVGTKNSGDSRSWGFQLSYYCLGTDEECGCQWVGIEEREKLIKLKVSPVPAKEIVNFEFGNIQSLQQAQLRCYDVFGNLLHSEAIVPGQKDVILDISSWPSGMYVAVVYSNGGVVGKSKFVVE
jgi:hypothetical protein